MKRLIKSKVDRLWSEDRARAARSFLQLHLLLPGHEFMALARQLTLTLTATDAAATTCNVQQLAVAMAVAMAMAMGLRFENREWIVALGTQMNLCMQSRIKEGETRAGTQRGLTETESEPSSLASRLTGQKSYSSQKNKNEREQSSRTVGTGTGVPQGVPQ